MRPRIAIVGGGIAGLALAALLDPERFEVTVREERPGRLGPGTPLALWPGAADVLRRCGAAAALDATAEGPASLAVRDARDRLLLRLRPPALRLVARPDLMAGLAAALPDRVERRTGAVTRVASLEADLVVGADGVRSRVRTEVWGIPPRRRRQVVLRGFAPGAWPEAVEYWTPGLVAGVVPLADGRSYWFAAFTAPEALEEADETVHRRALAERLAAVGALSGLAERIETIDAQRLVTTPAVRGYARGRYVLIGDAAHAMTPNLARGATEALRDAATLADSLHRNADPRRAARFYSHQRVTPTVSALWGSSAAMSLTTIRHGSRLRDGLLRRTLGRLGA